MLKCEVIRDLLPLYIDECCSSESKRLVEEHLKECGECRQLLCAMRQEVRIAPEEKEKNLEEEELLKSGKSVIEKEVKRGFVEKAAVIDIVLNIVFLLSFLFINFNKELSFKLRDSGFSEYGGNFMTGVLALMGLIAGIVYMARDRKRQDSVASKNLVILSIVWKLSVFLVYLAFAALLLLYE